MFQLEKKTLGLDVLIEGKLPVDSLNEIYNEIIERREEIYPNYKTSNIDSYDFINEEWWTYHDYAAVMKFPKLKIIFPYIAESLQLMQDQCKDYFLKSWVNIWPKGQSIGLHSHYGIWSGYFVIKDTETTTYYYPRGDRTPVPFKNYDGHFVFTSSKILHMVQNNPSAQLRVSMGFNISDWNEVLREEKSNTNGRGPKLRDILVPLKEYL